MRSPVFVALFVASFPAWPEELVATLGKERAAASPIQWEVRDTSHPVLGPIRFAIMKDPVTTPVGKAKISSRAYVSCERTTRRIAIELANGTSAEDSGGLKPKAMPRLVCNALAAPADRKVVQEDLEARWTVNELGDVLARGFRTFPLRECVSIHVVQEVVLPGGWGRATARVEFDITPYTVELDAIFATCGELSAYGVDAMAAPSWAPPAAPVASIASAPPPPVAPATPPPPKLGPAIAPGTPKLGSAQPILAATAPVVRAPSGPAASPWKEARVLASGKTNVRAAPNLAGAILLQLDPGSIVQVQQAPNDWWRARAKSASGAQVEGFIREDRLLFNP